MHDACSSSISWSISSGDTISLRAHTGKYIDVQGTTVKARGNDQGGQQALTIEKTGNGAIQAGDTIYLRAHTGKYIDVQGTTVKAHGNDQGGQQALTIEKSGDTNHPQCPLVVH